MTYWRLHYHLIFATADRQPVLTPEREKVFYGVLYGRAEDLGVKVHAAGNVDDHVHLVVSIPPNLSVAGFVKQVKGASAHAINCMPESDGSFRWQAGYGALSVSEAALEKVMAYAANQRQHHQDSTCHQFFVKMDE